VGKCRTGVIYNETRQTVAAERAESATTYWARLIGLMGRTVLEPGQALWLSPCNSVHMFFMRFTLDVVFLDKNNVVVGLVERLPVWHVSKIFWQAHTAIELPAGQIQQIGVHVGDKLCFRQS